MQRKDLSCAVFTSHWLWSLAWYRHGFPARRYPLKRPRRKAAACQHSR